MQNFLQDVLPRKENQMHDKKNVVAEGIAANGKA